MKHTIKKLPKSTLSIEVVIPADTFESDREKALKRAGEHVELPGFRKGKVPANILEKELNPMMLLEEMADIAINEHLPKVFKEEKIDAIGRPEITLTKVAKGNDLEFTATVATLPEVKLPDYKKIAAKENKEVGDMTVTDKELEEGIKELKKAREHNRIHQSGEEHDHAAFEKLEFDATLDDEYVKSLGAFENVDAFKEKFRENIKGEKLAREVEKRRIAIIEKLLEETKIEVPDLLIETEAENLINRMKADIAQAGMEFEEYLKHINKSEADIKKDLMPDAEKRAKTELVMMEIAKAEKLEPDMKMVEEETKRLIQTYQDADPTRARMYVAHMMLNEEILKFLETQK